MIFENDEVTELVIHWQQTGDSITLGEIFVKSKSLVEAIVSSYGAQYRDDMIQEAFLKIHRAITYYDKRFSLHNYFTTVIHNSCRTFLKKQSRTLLLYEDYDYAGEELFEYILDDDVLNDVIVRNRERFPSLPVNVCDDITEYIICSMTEGISKSRGIVSNIVKEFDISRSIATVIYHSTLVYLRGKYKDHAVANEIKDYEFTLLQDLRSVIGDTAFARITLLFSGMYIRIS